MLIYMCAYISLQNVHLCLCYLFFYLKSILTDISIVTPAFFLAAIVLVYHLAPLPFESVYLFGVKTHFQKATYIWVLCFKTILLFCAF